MFNKMLAAGKINRQILIQKLMGGDQAAIANTSNMIPEVSDISSRSINGPAEDVSFNGDLLVQDMMNENLIEDTSRDSNSRIAIEE